MKSSYKLIELHLHISDSISRDEPIDRIQNYFVKEYFSNYS